MLSLAEYKSSLCPICGYPKDVCQAAENSNKFVPNLPSRCHATTALRRAQKDPNNEYEHPDALIWSTTLSDSKQY